MKSARDRSAGPRLSQEERAEGVRAMEAAHRPGLGVAGPYGHPFHPMLVTVPIGAWVCTVAFDVASKVSDGRAYARAAVWLCAIGIVAAVVAAIAGFIDSRRITKGTKAHATAFTHMVLMVIVLVLFVASFVFRRVDSDSLTYLASGTPVVAMVLGIAGLLVMAVGGWFGGRLVFTYGVRVADEADQLEGHVRDKDDSAKAAVTESAKRDAPAPSTAPETRTESTS